MRPSEDSPEYKKKKAFFDSMLTIYGRKPVLEALQDKQLSLYRVHLADSNRPDGIVKDIIRIAEKRGVEVCYHDRKALSRISKNSKQDQGVAADIQLSRYQSLTGFMAEENAYSLIALDSVSNPQNVGMIVRSVAASPTTALLLPQKGCAALSPLVIKASAGALFKARIIYCSDIVSGLKQLQQDGATICTLSSHAEHSLYDYTAASKNVYVLGNETEGVSSAVSALCDTAIKIPMQNGVESLNVAVTAALLAFAAR